MTPFERNPHPFLDLSPLEQHLLMTAERDGVPVGLPGAEGAAIKHLKTLGLIEVQDAKWWPTQAAGFKVAHLLARAELARDMRRSRAPEVKKSAVLDELVARFPDLVTEIEALPVPANQGP